MLRFFAMPVRPVLARWLFASALAVASAVPPSAHGAEPPGGRAAPAREEPVWIGVALASPPGEPGAVARHVVHGGPASAAGMRDGDRVVRVDGAGVTSPEDVIRKVRAAGAGKVLSVVVARGTATTSLDVRVGPRPSPHEVLRMDLVGRPAPPLKVTPVGRAPRSLDELRGSVVLLDFWAPWCGPCRASMPRLDALASRLGAEGLKVVGIAEDTTPDRAQTAADALGARYPIASDVDGETMRAFGLSALPSLVVVDRKGVVREVLVGWDPGFEGRLAALVRGLLAEP